MSKMPPNDDGKLKVTAAGSPLIRETTLELSSSSLFDNNMAMIEENKTEYCNGVGNSHKDPSSTADNQRYINGIMNNLV